MTTQELFDQVAQDLKAYGRGRYHEGSHSLDGKSEGEQGETLHERACSLENDQEGVEAALVLSNDGASADELSELVPVAVNLEEMPEPVRPLAEIFLARGFQCYRPKDMESVDAPPEGEFLNFIHPLRQGEYALVGFLCWVEPGKGELPHIVSEELLGDDVDFFFGPVE